MYDYANLQEDQVYYLANANLSSIAVALSSAYQVHDPFKGTHF
jgi:hypothetical protein